MPLRGGAYHRRNNQYRKVGRFLRDLMSRPTCPKPLELIDFGCGGGGGRLYLPLEGLRYVGVEPNPKSAPRAKTVGAYVIRCDFRESEDYPLNRDVALCVRGDRFPAGLLLWRMSRAVAEGGLVLCTYLGANSERFLDEARKHLKVLKEDPIFAGEERLRFLVARR
jgi:hypothetical protein